LRWTSLSWLCKRHRAAIERRAAEKGCFSMLILYRRPCESLLPEQLNPRMQQKIAFPRRERGFFLLPAVGRAREDETVGELRDSFHELTGKVPSNGFAKLLRCRNKLPKI
jgi:hypothetical protein